MKKKWQVSQEILSEKRHRLYWDTIKCLRWKSGYIPQILKHGGRWSSEKNSQHTGLRDDGAVSAVASQSRRRSSTAQRER